jgi:8-oxo-dGTP pyrophosphatase MutT (NUDIX family)
MSSIRRRSYGIVPVAFQDDGAPLYLILRAYRNWDFPKGGAEPGETPLQAAERELAEETGILEFELAWGEVCKTTPVYSSDKVASYYPARVQMQELTLPVNPALGRPEHEEYRWVPYEVGLALLPPRLTAVLEWAREVVSHGSSQPAL